VDGADRRLQPAVRQRPIGCDVGNDEPFESPCTKPAFSLASMDPRNLRAGPDTRPKGPHRQPAVGASRRHRCGHPGATIDAHRQARPRHDRSPSARRSAERAAANHLAAQQARAAAGRPRQPEPPERSAEQHRRTDRISYPFERAESPNQGNQGCPLSV
jgi:hypothetical protein